MSSLFPVAVTVAIPVLVLVLARAAYLRWVRPAPVLRLPPGPKGIPLLGNVHQLPQEYQHRTFADWGSKHGDVVFARLFQTPTLVINSLRAAQDLLEKKGSKYSYRPRFILLSELMGWDSVITHMTYGERFRKHRKWIHEAFQDPTALRRYRPLQMRETYIMLSGLFDAPEHFMSHMKRFSAAIIMEITYGHSVVSLDDQYIHITDMATSETVRAGSPGSMLVDFFPALKHLPTWMPGAGFKRNAAQVKVLVRRLLDTPFDMVKRTMASGTAQPSFTAALLEEAACHAGGTRQEDEEDIKGAAGVIYSAGTDTTIGFLATFVLAMVLHPAVYRRAQDEIDRVVGHDRLPDFDDRDALPYLECIMKEVYRWNCPVPLGIPHKCVDDDEYRGYDIPGGSMVIPNIWAMTRDPDAYPDPDAFRPERFEEMDGATAALRDPRNMVFGFGRRICPGRRFADTSVWLAAANIVAALDIGSVRDARGAEVPPRAAFFSGFVSHPKDFACCIRPRSRKVQDIVAQLSASIVS